MKNLPEISLYNTMTRSVETLQPIEPGVVQIYCCGPTVYNYQHIGNLRTYIFEDVLTRMLAYAGYKVQHVMNITDVGHLVSDADEGEDKMLLASKREGKSSKEIAEFYTDVFYEHCKWLHIQRPTVVSKATEHIPQMISLIEKLEEKGIAYKSGGNVYYDVSKFPNYGKLARLNLENLQAGARIEVDSNKRNALDFALWFTKSKFENQELQWESPWGRGYPGWHIECSAMAMEYLGEHFDIHCGGIDHISVHHTNEIAQSEGASGKTFANVWMHGGFLVSDKEKMSKSKGEFLTLDKITERGFDPLSYRLFCLGSTYRHELSWSFEALEGAENTLRKLKSSVLELKSQAGNEETKESPLIPIEDFDGDPPEGQQIPLARERYTKEIREEFEKAIFSDLGTARALAVLHKTLQAKEISPSQKLKLLSTFDRVLGLGIDTWEAQTVEIPPAVIVLAETREGARAEKNWEEADRLRDAISELGFTIEDSKDGYLLKPQQQ